jgi:hypothetical protein
MNMEEAPQASFSFCERDLFPTVIFLLGSHREGEIPDPIPNSEVKPFVADGTAHKSVEE